MAYGPSVWGLSGLTRVDPRAGYFQRQSLPDCTWDFRSRRGLAFDEPQEVGIDPVRFSSRHAVRKAFVGFRGSVLQQLSGQGPGGDIRDLVPNKQSLKWATLNCSSRVLAHMEKENSLVDLIQPTTLLAAFAFIRNHEENTRTKSSNDSPKKGFHLASDLLGFAILKSIDFR